MVTALVGLKAPLDQASVFGFLTSDHARLDAFGRADRTVFHAGLLARKKVLFASELVGFFGCALTGSLGRSEFALVGRSLGRLFALTFGGLLFFARFLVVNPFCTAYPLILLECFGAKSIGLLVEILASDLFLTQTSTLSGKAGWKGKKKQEGQGRDTKKAHRHLRGQE